MSTDTDLARWTALGRESARADRDSTSPHRVQPATLTEARDLFEAWLASGRAEEEALLALDGGPIAMDIAATHERAVRALRDGVLHPRVCAHHRTYPGDDFCRGEPENYCEEPTAAYLRVGYQPALDADSPLRSEPSSPRRAALDAAWEAYLSEYPGAGVGEVRS